MNQASSRHSAPPRLERPSPIAFILLLAFAAFFISGFSSADIHSDRLLRGVMNLGTFFGEALPPDFARWDVIAMAMLETFQMAIVGVVFGVILSLPMALLCARNTSPHPVIRVIARNLVATLRTVPDLVWALIFVVAVGLGPLAGILAIIMDTIGFCARFFSERIEEVDPGQAPARPWPPLTPRAAAWSAAPSCPSARRRSWPPASSRWRRRCAAPWCWASSAPAASAWSSPPP